MDPDAESSAGNLARALAALAPARAGLEILAQSVATASLLDLCESEVAAVAGAIRRRQLEFACGRHLARRAMRRLGHPPEAVPPGSRREPLWPSGIVGSITHADGIACVALARAAAVRSVGLDLEVPGRVGPELHSRLFTAAERDWLAEAPPQMPGLLFAAKESVYKATYPLVGRFIGFHEVEVRVDLDACALSFDYVGPHPENRVMEEVSAGYVFVDGLVAVLAVLAAAP